MLNFEYKTYGKDLTPNNVPSNVRIVSPKIYVARLVVSKPEQGVGFNIVFSPSNPAHQEVAKELYPRTLHRLGVEKHTLPFGILWADAYYYQGLAYFRGNIEGDVVDSGYEVFDLWDMTWAYLHTDVAIFFRLDPPYIPSNAKEIIEKF